MSVYDSPDKVVNQISLYAARGTLIESEGPSWFYGTGSEHAVLYQYQLYGAKDVSNPRTVSFSQADSLFLNRSTWATYKVKPLITNLSRSHPTLSRSGNHFRAIRPLQSAIRMGAPPLGDFELSIQRASHCTVLGELYLTEIFKRSKTCLPDPHRMYSFFQEYYQDCLDTFNCQERICEVKGSKKVALFNVFTIGTVEVASGIKYVHIQKSASRREADTSYAAVNSSLRMRRRGLTLAAFIKSR